jgi:hypothetical protein
MYAIVLAIPMIVGLTGPARPDGHRFTLQTVNGRSIETPRVSIERGVVNYQAGAQDADIPLEDVSSLTPPHAPDRAGRVDGPQRVVILADGGRLAGELVADGSANNSIVLEVEWSEALAIPYSAVAAVQFDLRDNAAAEEALAALLEKRDGGHDVLIVLRDGKPVTLPGILEGISPQSWSFRIGRQVRTAALEKAYGVVLGSSGPSRRGPATLHLLEGDSLTAWVRTADGAGLELDAAALGKVTVPWSSVESIDLRSQRVVDLSEMVPAEVVQRSMFDAHWPVTKDRNLQGRPIVLAGRSYSRGIAVHSYCALTFRLDGAFERFLCDVGIDESVAPHGSAVFRVTTDGKVAFESPSIGPTTPQHVDVDLKGVNVLVLECDVGDDLDLSDHGAWAGARLIRARIDGIR